MCFQQGKVTIEYVLVEEEDAHVGMAEACREEYKVKGSSHEKIIIGMGTWLV